MTFHKLLRRSTFALPAQPCLRPSRGSALSDDVDPWRACSPRDVIARAVDILDPTRTLRLTALLNAPTVVQVPRQHVAGQGGVEELLVFLPPPGMPRECGFALAASSDDTLRFGRFSLPAGGLDAVRRQVNGTREAETDALQALMQAHGQHLVAARSACAEVALVESGGEPIGPVGG